MNNRLNIKHHVGEPLPKNYTENATKVKNHSELKVDQLAHLQRQCSKQLQSLKEIYSDLVCLELQVKKITSTDPIVNNCNQCVGKTSNLCGRCVIYIGKHTVKHPNSSEAAEKGQLSIAVFDAMVDAIFDEGQEDGYWL